RRRASGVSQSTFLVPTRPESERSSDRKSVAHRNAASGGAGRRTEKRYGREYSGMVRYSYTEWWTWPSSSVIRMHSPSHANRHASQTMHSGPRTESDFSPRNWNFAATVGSSTTSGTSARGRSSKTFTGQTSLQWEQPVHFAMSMSTWTMADQSPRASGY